MHRVPRVRVDRRQKGNFLNRVPFIFFPPARDTLSPREELRAKSTRMYVHARAWFIAMTHRCFSPKHDLSSPYTGERRTHTHTYIAYNERDFANVCASTFREKYFQPECLAN
ncbi:hypothetical protein K0M31_002857 [Melipona bicolor]|uniref:Uncharacterized protein n=1 Tax=Melipona bicolor TaxID=60889 RepID=A0AA40FZN3_9HYME|nr:hypothetical protein K0M31_002857 [Melipona bicolor]